MITDIDCTEYVDQSPNMILSQLEILQNKFDSYVPKNKKNNLEKDMEKIQEELFRNLELSQCKTSEALYYFLVDSQHVYKDNASERWDEIKMTYKPILFEADRARRRNDLQNVQSVELFQQALWWMNENGNEEDMTIIKKIYENLPVISTEFFEQIELIIKNIQNRINRLKSHENWAHLCKEGRVYSKKKYYQILSEIVESSRDEIPNLKKLVNSSECQSMYRRAAIDRLIQLLPDHEAEEFLRLFLLSYDPDENVKITAYEGYCSKKSSQVFNNDIITQIQKHLLASTDPSSKLHWLVSLNI